jgi:hypothetical protein
MDESAILARERYRLKDEERERLRDENNLQLITVNRNTTDY